MVTVDSACKTHCIFTKRTSCFKYLDIKSIASNRRGKYDVSVFRMRSMFCTFSSVSEISETTGFFFFVFEIFFLSLIAISMRINNVFSYKSCRN